MEDMDLEASKLVSVTILALVTGLIVAEIWVYTTAVQFGAYVGGLVLLLIIFAMVSVAGDVSVHVWVSGSIMLEALAWFVWRPYYRRNR